MNQKKSLDPETPREIAKNQVIWLSLQLGVEVTRREALEDVLSDLSSHLGAGVPEEIEPEAIKSRIRESFDLHVQPLDRDARRYRYLRRHGCIPIGSKGPEIPMAGEDLDSRVDAVVGVPVVEQETASRSPDEIFAQIIAKLSDSTDVTADDKAFLQGVRESMSIFQTILQFRREDDMRAIALWQQEHGADIAPPPHADIVAWLIRRLGQNS